MATTDTSCWISSAPQPEMEPLTENLRAEVCVIGAGIAGLTTAYLLAREGRQVVVLEAQPTIVPGESAHTTAHLTCVIDDRFSEVERIHGERILRLAVQSHQGAIDWIEWLIAEEKIACDFRRVDGYLILGPGDSEELLEKEADAARRIGLPFEWLSQPPLPGPRQRASLRFPQQAQFHPLKYLEGLNQALLSRGGKVYTGSPVARITGGKPGEVFTRAGKSVICDAIVVATNTPINAITAIHTKQAPYTTYALAADIPVGDVPPGLYWDTLDPYHYIRTHPANDSHDILIVGGCDHKTGQSPRPEEHQVRLERWAREHFPRMGPVRNRWSGQVMETIDGLAFIGRDPGGMVNVYVATGDSGMGMTHGTLAGLILTDTLHKRYHPWAQVYDSTRKPLGASREYLEENLNVAAQYLDWVTPGDGALKDIPPGSGAVIRQGLTKLAVYRDEQGDAHVCSAVCPHLGCVVHWNSLEETFDCPCHGSRFSKEGQVIHGPAMADLAKTTRGSELSEATT
ncbi:MAG: FAD-dependent oxidoreductase [Gemmataceae bacterium]